MAYNIHPIIAHFPIALLFLYSIITILPMDKWMPSVSWRQIRQFLLFFGFLSALVGLSTGETAQEITAPDRALVEAHQLFANIASWIYGILLAGEVVYVFKMKYASLPIFSKPIIQKSLNMKEKILCNPIFVKILAVAGFITITITGMLGGVMVYGTSADPLAPIVLKMLGITL